MSSEIVKKAKENGRAIILEDLHYIKKTINRLRKALNPVNKKVQEVRVRNRSIRRRLNLWPARKFQKMIEYKAAWEGVKVIYVSPRNTSALCAVCGSRIAYLNARRALCPNCGEIDRQYNARLNLLKTIDGSLRFGDDRPPDVAMTRALTNSKGGCGKAWGAKGGKLLIVGGTPTIS